VHDTRGLGSRSMAKVGMYSTVSCGEL
jgi:hypothetical protein